LIADCFVSASEFDAPSTLGLAPNLDCGALVAFNVISFGANFVFGWKIAGLAFEKSLRTIAAPFPLKLLRDCLCVRIYSEEQHGRCDGDRPYQIEEIMFGHDLPSAYPETTPRSIAG